MSNGTNTETVDVSKSGYYVWKNRKPSARKLEEERIKVAIKDLWNREIVGYNSTQKSKRPRNYEAFCSSPDCAGLILGGHETKEFELKQKFRLKLRCWRLESYRSIKP